MTRCADASRSCSAGVCRSATSPSDFIVGSSCSRKPGSFCRPAAICGPALGRGPRRVARLVDEAPDVLAVGGEVADDRVGVDGRGPRASCSARPGASRTRSVSRSAGIARRIAALSSGPRPGDARAELGDDDPQPLALGLAQDVVDEVGRDRRRRLRDGDPRARLQRLRAPCPAGSRGSTRRSATAGATRSARRGAASRSRACRCGSRRARASCACRAGCS